MKLEPLKKFLQPREVLRAVMYFLKKKMLVITHRLFALQQHELLHLPKSSIVTYTNAFCGIFIKENT